MDSKPADRHSWERRDDESEKAFAAFKVFLEMGEARTVRDAYRQVSGNPGASQAAGYFSEWSSKFEWFPRAADYDRHLFRVEVRTVETERAKWTRRRSALREDAWNDAAALRARARAILNLPLVETVEQTETIEDEGKTVHRTTIIHKPVNAKPAEAGRMLDVADRLGRLAAEMETDRLLVDTPEKKRARQLQAARVRFQQSAELFPLEPEDVRAATIAAAFGFSVDEITVPPQLASDSVS
jgi:hypothetical protein